jgi:hypothetical protein
MVDADRKEPAPLPPVKPAAAPATQGASQSGAETPPVKQATARTVAQSRLPEDLVLVDRPGDGKVWARSRSYKASFDGAGASYIPFLGSDAPQNYPVDFALRGVRAGGEVVEFKANGVVTTDGRRVSIDRGALVENYDLSATGMEQSFVFKSLPNGGDLIVRVGVRTELTQAVAGEGFRFANERGQVNYGAAVIVDANGQRAPMQSTFDDNVIQLRAPASFLAKAAFPVTVDPIVSTFTASQSLLVEYGADVAYDLGQDRYLVVWEEVFSLADHDIGSVLRNPDGSVVTGTFTYIDHTTDTWSNPSVANVRQQQRFLVVAQRGVAPARQIWGRTREAGSSVLGNQFEISVNGGSGDKFNPEVGGDPHPAGVVCWNVVWQRNLSATDSDIHAQMINEQGSLHGGLILVDNSGNTLDTDPAISKSDGNAPAGSQNWTIVWHRQFNPGDGDIHFARIRWDGAMTTTSSILDNSTLNHTNPTVSSPTDELSGNRYTLVCCELENGAGGEHDIVGMLVRGATKLVTRNLSALDGQFQSRDQLSPHVDSDGVRFLVAWAEQYSGFDWDVRASTYHMIYGSQLAVSDVRVALGFTGTAEQNPRVTSIRSAGGVNTRYAAVWDYEFSATDWDIQGAIYDGVGAGGFNLVPTGCGGLGMATAGNAALGGVASFQMTGVGANTPLIMFSLPINPLTVCVGCGLGVNLNLATIMAGSTLNLPIPPEGAFVGGTLAVQGFTYGTGPCVGGQIKMSDTALFTIR